MFSSVQIYQNIETMRILRGISQRQMLVDCGLSRGVMENMKKGSMPSVDKIALLADYFGCSIDQIVGRETKIAPIQADRSDLAENMKDLSKDELVKLIEFAKFLRSQR